MLLHLCEHWLDLIGLQEFVPDAASDAVLVYFSMQLIMLAS